MSYKMTPWQRIARASRRGTGLRLSQDECWLLSQDDAIATRAQLDDARDRPHRFSPPRSAHEHFAGSICTECGENEYHQAHRKSGEADEIASGGSDGTT